MAKNTCIPKPIVESLKERARNGQISAEDITKMLPTEKAELKSILEDFVAEKLGIKVSTEEVSAINIRAKAIDEALKKLGTDMGNPAKRAENVAFFKAKREMDVYLMSRHPSSQVRIMTGTVGRGMMLLSVASPLTNIESNVVLGAAEAIVRRVATGRLRGTDNQLVLDYVKMSREIYQSSGYDISRMMSLKDSGSMGERVLEDTIHSEGPGVWRKTGRIVQDIVFKQLLGAPDNAFGSAAFGDSVNLSSLQMAKGDKTQAREWMVDSMRVEPLTPEGELLKAQGVLDATTATWTNKTWASRMSSAIRKIINDVTGDVRAGDFLMSFIKTKSNVVALSMDYSGMGIPKSLIATYKAVRSGELRDPEYLRYLITNVMRSGLGLTGAYILSALFDDDDFMGAYDPNRQQIEALRNTDDNMIRIGGKWVSTDYLGPFAVPITAMLYAKKYGHSPGGKAVQFAVGVGRAVEEIPGIEGILDFGKTLAQTKGQTLVEMTESMGGYAMSQLTSRLIPNISGHLAKAVDSKERLTQGKWDQFKAKIPVLRETLPEKRDIFGETINTESALSVILFGSRVKTDKETPLIKELSDVQRATGKSLNFTDWNKSPSKTLAQFRAKVTGETYEQATIKYGQKLKSMIEEQMRRGEYRNMSEDDKLTILVNLDTKAMNEVLSSYGFKYQKRSK